MTDLTRFDVLDRRPVEIRPAPRLGRLFAWVVDFIVVTVASVFVLDAVRPGTAAQFLDGVQAWVAAIGADPAAVFAPPPPVDELVVVWIALSLVYHSLCVALVGVSVGKLVMVISVVNLDRRRRVNVVQSVGRQVLWIVDAWGVAPLCILLRRDGRRVGELATNTMTVSGLLWNRPLASGDPAEPVRAGFHLPGAVPGTSRLPSADEVVAPPPLATPVTPAVQGRLLPPTPPTPPRPEP